MKIGFLLHNSPEHHDSHTVKRLAESFIDLGHEVSIFLMEDGVYNAFINHSAKGLSPGFDKLITKGAKVSLCTFTADIRGLKKENIIEGVEFQSQYDLSRLVSESDRFLSFV